MNAKAATKKKDKAVKGESNTSTKTVRMKSKMIEKTKPVTKPITEKVVATNKKVEIKKQVVAKPAVEKTPVKERYKLVTKKKQVESQRSPKKVGIVYGIQKALLAKGFDPGSMDGKMGPATAKALKAFQKSRGLPIGQLNKDTFRALGLIR